jgi:hypothetical protein
MFAFQAIGKYSLGTAAVTTLEMSVSGDEVI